MTTMTARDAKARFGGLLDRVSRGEEIVITRQGKPVARIVPEGRPALNQVREAASELRALRKEMMGRRGFRPLTVKEIKDSINQGRR